ncbi:hypothetical protein B1H18_01510 [Streptomyces tsukubensis]|uniref:Sulfotransferase family protein n=1 Tax=Streptomyces tsukubensis TaxID=83656 RepID=A0A1V4AG78_9ACTN|nr:hypothetical protein B1H18_01510 [Streptomyces tsukubensis]
MELVFRTVGERTSRLSLDLALAHVKPQRAHVVSDVKPFARTVRRMLRELDHRCSHVVFVDADCLILEDLRPFLDVNDLPCVDCYGHDRFRGRVHGGARISRIDVVRGMGTWLKPLERRSTVLWPEGYLVGAVLRDLGLFWQYKHFPLLHDHFQRYTDIFRKYALWQLRSREGVKRRHLERSAAGWGPDAEFVVARHALRHAAGSVSDDAEPREIGEYIRSLPRIAPAEVAGLGLVDQDGEARAEDITAALAAAPSRFGPPPGRCKVFGVGLPGTGTQSLSRALHTLGFSALHDPGGEGGERLGGVSEPGAAWPSLLAHYDGMTGMAAAHRFRELDRRWPGSKFVLTVRDEESWSRWWGGSSRTQRGGGRPLSGYRDHVRRLTEYFAGRQDDLLVLDVAGGEGYEKLAPFLGTAVPDQAFPHRGERRAARSEGDSL